MGDATEDAGNFLERKFPCTLQRTCRRVMEVRICLAAFCLRQNFGGFLRKLLKSLQAAFFQSFPKNPPEFSPAGENSVPRQGIWPFNLKAKFTDRANARLNRCSQNEKSLLAAFSKFRSSLAGKTRSRISRIIHRWVRSSPENFLKFRSSLFKGLT